MQQITERVWRPDATPQSHTYLISSGERWVLVDAGYPWQAGKLVREIMAVTERLDGVLLTHHDLDHIGSLGLLQEHFGAPVYVPEADRQFFAGAKKALRRKNVLTRLGGLLSRTPGDLRPLGDHPFGEIEAMWMPGHTPGHTVFRFGDVVFAGDMFFNYTGKGLENLWKYHEDQHGAGQSLAKLADMTGVTFLPAHGEPLKAGGDNSAKLKELSEALLKS